MKPLLHGALAAVLLVLAAQSRADETDKPIEGKPAPTIDLPATSIGTVLPDKKDAKLLKLADFKGKKNVVVWFFPKAMTGG